MILYYIVYDIYIIYIKEWLNYVIFNERKNKAIC